MNTTHAPNMLE